MKFLTALGWRRTLPLGLLAIVAAAFPLAATAAEPKLPAVGDEAADFELPRLSGETAKLSALAKEGPVVVVVLRGWPGYQCPLCTRQVGQFIGAAKKFQDAGAKVVFIYPGPAESLKKHAEEFAADTKLPEGFQFVIDPGYTFTNAWNLRWDAPRETAYPSTFVVGGDQKIRFAQISKTHGGRADVNDVLKALGN